MNIGIAIYLGRAATLSIWTAIAGQQAVQSPALKVFSGISFGLFAAVALWSTGRSLWNRRTSPFALGLGRLRELDHAYDKLLIQSDPSGAFETFLQALNSRPKVIERIRAVHGAMYAAGKLRNNAGQLHPLEEYKGLMNLGRAQADTHGTLQSIKFPSPVLATAYGVRLCDLMVETRFDRSCYNSETSHQIINKQTIGTVCGVAANSSRVTKRILLKKLSDVYDAVPTELKEEKDLLRKTAEA